MSRHIKGALTGTEEFPTGDLLVKVYKALFLAYICAVAAFQRDFARLCFRVLGVPVFTGETAILVLGILLLAITFRYRRLPFRMRAFEWLLGAYLVVGAYFTVQGLSRGFGLAVVRDAALVYYAVFALFALSFHGLGGRLSSLVNGLVSGAAVGAAVWTIRFLVAPSLLDGHGVPSFAGIVSWIGVVGILLRLKVGNRWLQAARWLGLAACSFVVYLSAYRTMLGVLLVTLVVLLVARVRLPEFSNRLWPWLLGVWLAVMVAFAGVLLLHLPVPPSPLVINGPVSVSHALSVISHRWLAGGVRGETVQETVRLPDGTTREVRLRNPGSVKGSIVFRKRAWSNALARIRRYPLLGIGFGPPSALFPDFQCEIFSSPLSNCGNAHNTYLTLAMRMGLPILALFGTASGMALWRGLRAVRGATAATEGVPALMPLLASTVGLAAYGFMSLLLESPYLAVLFWTTLGGVAARHTGSVPMQSEAHCFPSPHSAASGTRWN